ncbi:MAG TPA: hypothetical protein VFA81_11375 [Burkholderiales bacterium]|nr:hypothetical protein [Burkholderiales bacterium]
MHIERLVIDSIYLIALYLLRRFARAEFEEDVASLPPNSNDPRLSFDAKTATVVCDSVSQHPMELSFHRIYKNPYGEYFLVMSDGPRPYVCHLSKVRAMNALRHDREAFVREFGAENAR